jgi:hypothetical protein
MGATVLVVHDPQHGTDEYEKALERLSRDPKVQVIGSGVDAGARVAFFRLAPGPGPRGGRPRALRSTAGPGPG